MSNRDRRVRRVGAGWGFVVDVASPSGKRRQIRRQGFPTSTAANAELRRVLEAATDGVVVTRGGITVGDYLTQRWVPSLDGVASARRLATVGYRTWAARAWSTDQLARFLRATAGSGLEPGWRFLLLTGCWRGELCGLRWSDLDLERGTVTITNQRTTAGGRIVEGPPTTAAGSRLSPSMP